MEEFHVTTAQYRLLRKRCVRCGDQDARTLNGKHYCGVCLDKHNEWERAKNQRDPETVNAKKPFTVSTLS